MRICFRRIESTDESFLNPIVSNYDIIARLNPSSKLYLDFYTISNVLSYTDDSRYDLNIFDLKYDRSYKNNFIVNEKKGGYIKVAHISLNFDMPFDFILLSDEYLNKWKRNDEIDFIRPKVVEFNRDSLGQKAFRSISCSYFAKMLSLIYSNNVLCFKKGKDIILSYNIENQETINNTDMIIDCFLNAIYEIVKSVSGWIDLPQETGMININMQEWYDSRRKNNKKRYIMYNTK